MGKNKINESSKTIVINFTDKRPIQTGLGTRVNGI